ncbi:immunoglobulin-like domain-containing protein, partial [Lancefieldella parvula]|uniref:immunoglobulin-like domain-containing protein n=1 Tax=Lancefieldella parvula TaxID=1382 RepID=UPI0028D22F66
MFKKALNSLFSILLVLALLPAPAFAEAAGELTTTVTATSSTETALAANDSASGTEAVSGTVAATSSAVTTSEETGPGVAATANETDYPHKTLDQAVETLTNSFYKPKPRYGVDTNLNTMVAEELRRIGAGEVNVRVTSVQMSSTASYAHAGISTDFATNGSIEYFWMDAAGFTNQRSTLILRQAKVTFELSKDGKTVQYTCNVLIPWDEAKSQAQLADVSQNLSPSYAAGQNESSVTSDFTLPHKLVSADGSQLSWSKVTWTSSDTSTVRIDGYGTEPYKATVTRGIRDKQVTLTANVSLSSSDAPQTSYQKTFTITVPGDSSAITDAQNNLLRRINRRFSASSIKDVYTNHSIDSQAVADDLQMPTPKNFGLDG